jgi:iron(III) transport system substrate-binding protein
MKKTMWMALPVLLATTHAAHAQSGEFNMICSAQAAWCNMLAVTFEKSQGIKVNMTLKGSGEALAQIMAERANPKTDIWFGGTGDPHLQAAEQNLTLEYKSPPCPSCTPGRKSRRSNRGFRTVGIYSGPLGFGYNTELLAKKKLPVPKTWATCSSPSTRAKSSQPTRHPAARPTPWSPRWCS